MTHRVALIGAGAMGGAIGKRFVGTGVVLNVFDLDKTRIDELVAKGAIEAASSAEAAAKSDYIVLSLNSARIIRAAVFGDGGIVEGARPGTLIIDMSSIDPAATRELAADAEKSQLRWVDSPLSGGPPKVQSGELTLMVGGSGKDFAESYQLLQHVATNITHMGPVGTGQTTKLINQMLCGLGFLAMAEVTQLALNTGIDATKIPAALKGGRADSSILQEYMPRFVARDYQCTGRIGNMVKDLDAIMDLARSTQTPVPLTSLCNEIHRLSAAQGFGREDQATLMELFKRPGRPEPLLATYKGNEISGAKSNN